MPRSLPSWSPYFQSSFSPICRGSCHLLLKAICPPLLPHHTEDNIKPRQQGETRLHKEALQRLALSASDSPSSMLSMLWWELLVSFLYIPSGHFFGLMCMVHLPLRWPNLTKSRLQCLPQHLLLVASGLRAESPAWFKNTGSIRTVS